MQDKNFYLLIVVRCYHLSVFVGCKEMPFSKKIIGIDLGATRIKSGVVVNSQIIEKAVNTLEPTNKSESGIVSLLCQIVYPILRRNPDIVAVGIGAPGVIRAENGVITSSPNFPEWKDFPIGRKLEEHLKIPVFLDNDANAVALGEALFGAGRGVKNLICFTLGSGVGGGIILDGKIFRGPDGMAGEIGHVVVEPEGFPCMCGGRGCLEQYASFNGLKNMVLRDRFFGDQTENMVKNPDLPKILFDMAIKGNQQARQYYNEFGYRLAIVIGGLLNILNPHLIILSGGLARAYPLFKDTLLSELPNRAFKAVVSRAKIVQCELWEDGGILGSVAVALQALQLDL